MLTHSRLVDGPPKATVNDTVGNAPPASKEHTQNVGRWADFCRATRTIFKHVDRFSTTIPASTRSPVLLPRRLRDIARCLAPGHDLPPQARGGWPESRR